jgi:hypothetical protein
MFHILCEGRVKVIVCNYTKAGMDYKPLGRRDPHAWRGGGENTPKGLEASSGVVPDDGKLIILGEESAASLRSAQ